MVVSHDNDKMYCLLQCVCGGSDTVSFVVQVTMLIVHLSVMCLFVFLMLRGFWYTFLTFFIQFTCHYSHIYRLAFFWNSNDTVVICGHVIETCETVFNILVTYCLTMNSCGWAKEATLIPYWSPSTDQWGMWIPYQPPTAHHWAAKCCAVKVLCVVNCRNVV